MTQNRNRRQEITGLAWYKPNQWARLLQVCEDVDDLPRTYLEWLESANKRLREMGRSGANVRKIYVDVDELADWCARHDLPVDRHARRRYVAERAKDEW